MPYGQTIVAPASRMERKTRSPKHTFQVRTRPFQFQPVAIAPVLPGETLMRAVFQSRAVTDPIKNGICGWHKEYGLWYVKLVDLYEREPLMEMLLDPAKDMSALDSASLLAYYHVNGTMSPAINWPLLCSKRIVDEYFRYEGEDWDDYQITPVGGAAMPAVPINRDLYIDSLINADLIDESATFDENLVSAVAGQGDATTAVLTSEIDAAMRRYNLARLHGLTEMTYEDWLEAHGIRQPQNVQQFKPELLRIIREWQYPSNHVNTSTGVPTSAVSWAIQDTLDKPRLFKEPGFLVFGTWARPKVYFENLTSNAVMLMNSAKDWSPMLLEDQWASMKKIATAGDPPVDANTDAYWLDIKDIFHYGDQFINFALNDANANIVALPTAAGVHRYLTTDAELDGLFAAASPANQIREDGVIQFHIKSGLRETSPNSIGTNIVVP